MLSTFLHESIGNTTGPVTLSKLKLWVNQEETDSVKIGRGIRQGYCISPTLFNLYGEYLMKEALAEFGDLKIGGRNINKVRFGDHTAIIVKTQEELQIWWRDWLTLERSIAWKPTLTNHK